MKLTLISAGTYMMGSSARDTAAFVDAILPPSPEQDVPSRDRYLGEEPQHQVRITRSFYLGTFHVTRGQFRQFVKDTRYKTDAEKFPGVGGAGWNPKVKYVEFAEKFSWRSTGFDQTDDHPVVNVSWNDAVAFCKWLSKKEGKTYRLPSEAEWEYACRAGTTTRYYSGDEPNTLVKVGNVADAVFKAKFTDRKDTIRGSDGYLFTAPVGQFQPNAFGLYDMHGNAWQWCGDWYDEDYYRRSPIDDPTGPDSGSDRVLRGGCWDSGLEHCRSAARNRGSPGGPHFPSTRNCYTGFRIAWTPQ